MGKRLVRYVIIVPTRLVGLTTYSTHVHLPFTTQETKKTTRPGGQPFCQTWSLWQFPWLSENETDEPKQVCSSTGTTSAMPSNAKQCQAVPSSQGALSGSNFPSVGGLTMSWLRSKTGPCLRTCDLVKSVFILPSMHWFRWNWTGKPLKHIETYSGWWFQPLWKILVSWDYYSQYMDK